MEPTRLILLIGSAIGIVLGLWAQLWPRSQWRLLWAPQYRFSHVPAREQDAYVRRLTAGPLAVSVILAVVVVVTA